MIQQFECPYCMEKNSIELDPVQDINQQMIQDCEICCQPIELWIQQSITSEYSPISDLSLNIIAKQDGE